MKLLTVGDAKTSKGEPLGYLTGILYLAPSTESGRNVCPFASPGCIKGCLDDAGRAAIFPAIHQARLRKTRWFTQDKYGFMQQLHRDIWNLVKLADKRGMTPAVRINGTSDLAELADVMVSNHSSVQFYDYTKIPKPYLRVRDNYHLTFSLHEHNLPHAIDALKHGVNVAVVFHVARGKPLPKTFLDAPVIDGDLHDLRFLNGYKGSIIGLRAKGPAKKDSIGFVQIAPGTIGYVTITRHKKGE